MVEAPAPSDVPPRIGVSEEPVYRIGWDDAERSFETLTAGALLRDGRAVVVDGGRTQELVILSPSGSVEATLGGPGEGPGEFTSVSSIAVRPGDTILIQDAQGGRISKFTPDGFVESIRAEGANLLYLHGVDAETGSLMLGMPLAMVFGRRYDTPFLAVPQVRLDWTTRAADTVAMADWDQSIATGGGNNPFMSGGFSTVSGSEFVVGRGDRAELRWIDRDGAVRQIVRWPARATEVPDSIVAAWESRSRTFFEEIGIDEADIERRITAMKDAVQEPLPLFGLPGSMPSAGGILGDPTGNVWIARYRPPGQGPPQTYWVMSPEGEWLGAVEIPHGVRVLDVGSEYLLGVERNEFDVEAAALYRLEGRP
ncbi:MAG: hypothetical protein EA351_13650 [Gemmatimonadales bacterium]|nr:MAG: hypothetical protein EA351_13650 [Gemmatimonadales bacterium]